MTLNEDVFLIDWLFDTTIIFRVLTKHIRHERTTNDRTHDGLFSPSFCVYCGGLQVCLLAHPDRAHIFINIKTVSSPFKLLCQFQLKIDSGLPIEFIQNNTKKKFFIFEIY